MRLTAQFSGFFIIDHTKDGARYEVEVVLPDLGEALRTTAIKSLCSSGNAALQPLA